VISFRYHIVSIVSVFLALAVGIALGGGPLKGEVDTSLVKELATRKTELAAQANQLAALRASTKFDDSYAATSANAVLRKRLAGKSVALVTLPDADHGAGAEISTLIQNAGGRITGSFSIGSKLGKVANRQLVEELTSQMATSTKVAVASDATGYERLGELMGRAIGSKTGGSAYDATADSIMSGLSTAGLVTADGQPSGRADLVLVLAGPADRSDLGGAANTIISQVLGSLATSTDGLVLTGPAGSAKDGGLLKVTRDDVSLERIISTVDSADSGAGQVVAVLALVERAGGTIGQWGAVDAQDGTMPGAPKP
jgi:hypothetical protein